MKTQESEMSRRLFAMEYYDTYYFTIYCMVCLLTARRSVFYRDRGLCGTCHRDISGLVSIHSDKHYDHIVPLAQGGINDVTNLQLLCEKCNLKKKDGLPNTSKYYEKWYT